MDTLTMIKEAFENPGQEFETVCGTVKDRVHCNRCLLKWVNSKHAFLLSDTTMEYKWRKAQALIPVSFMEAVKRHHTGKTIICKMFNDYYYFTRRPAGMIDNIGNAINSGKILEGEWYVEE